MPGSDDQYDQVHTYSQDHAGKSKTTKPAVREIGRDGAPVQLYVGQDVEASALRTPPANTRFLFFDTSGNLRKKNPDGTTDRVGGGAPSDASYVTTSAESELSNETVASDLQAVYGSPVPVGSGVDLDLSGGGGIDDDAGNVITDFVGQGLEVVSGALQLLSTIWDGTNIVANVDNSRVATDTLGSGGGITSTDINTMEGPGIQVNTSNELESDPEIPADVSASRSFGTWETNGTGNPLVVYATADVNTLNFSGYQVIDLRMHVNNSQSDNQIYVGSRSEGDAADGESLVAGVVGEVPDGAEYKVEFFFSGTDSAVNMLNFSEQERGV